MSLGFRRQFRWWLVGTTFALSTVVAEIGRAPDLTPSLKFRREAVELPFLACDTNQVAVTAKLGSREGRWLVDTNFFVSVANHLPPKADWFRRTQYTWTVLYGEQHRVLPVVGYKKLSIGDGLLTVNGFAVAPSLAEPAFMQEQGSPDADGIIGLDVLRAARAMIDYQARTLMFRAKSVDATAAAPADVIARLPLLEGSGKQVAVAARLAGRTFALLVDTGSEYTIISRDIAKAESSARPLPSISQWTYAGTVEFERVEVEGFQLGDHSLGKRVLLVSDDFSRHGLEAGGLPVVGVIGADILAAQRSRIDFGEGILYLRGDM